MRIFRAPQVAAAALLLLPWFAGCASVGQVDEANNHTGVYSYRHHLDSFTGVTTDQVRGAFDVSVPSWIPFKADTFRPVDFAVRRTEGEEDAGPSYSLIVSYTGDDWDSLGVVPAGQTLTLLLDGVERIQLTGEGSRPGRGAYSGGVYEVAQYAITHRQLERVAAANTIQIKLDGDRGSESGTVEAGSRKRIAGLLKLFPR